MQQMFVNYDTIQKPMTFIVVVNEYFLKNPISKSSLQDVQSIRILKIEFTLLLNKNFTTILRAQLNYHV